MGSVGSSCHDVCRSPADSPARLSMPALQPQVWTLDTTGRVSDRLPVMLPLSPHGYDDGGMPDVMVQVAWMPGSSTRLVVAALHCLWLYDLAFAAKQPAIRVEVSLGSPIVGFTAVVHQAPALSPGPGGLATIPSFGSLGALPESNSPDSSAVRSGVVGVLLCQDGVMCSVALPSESDSISQIVGYRGDGFTTKCVPFATSACPVKQRPVNRG